MAFPNSNYPVSPAGSQMAGKPGYASSLGMRGTVSPNVTIGMPKKPPYRQQQEEGKFLGHLGRPHCTINKLECYLGGGLKPV